MLPILHCGFPPWLRHGKNATSWQFGNILDASLVVLVTRPRRFGKTLNMTTLRYFYGNDADYSGLFEGLEITRQGEQYVGKFGKHPVLFMSFWEVKDHNWKNAYVKLFASLQSATGLFYKDYPQIRQGLDLDEQGVLDRSGSTRATRGFCKACFLKAKALSGKILTG